jgi:hypothetical protein
LPTAAFVRAASQAAKAPPGPVPAAQEAEAGLSNDSGASIATSSHLPGLAEPHERGPARGAATYTRVSARAETSGSADAISRPTVQSRDIDPWRCEMALKSTKRPSRRRRDIDKAFDAYIDWREECVAVQDAYDAWTGKRGADAALAFHAYGDALEREEWAATVYARLATQLDDLVQIGEARQPAEMAPGRGGR